MRLASILLLAPLAFASVTAAYAADPAGHQLAAHRATYDLKLAASKTVQAANGSMTYEFLDKCEGWATQQRLDMTVTNEEGQAIHMLSDYSTFESKDGLHMRYRMKQTTDTAVTSEVEGESSLAAVGGAGTATYTLPHPATLPLPTGTLFPTAHTVALLGAAESGAKFLALPLFDGTSAKGPEDSSIVMNAWVPDSETLTKQSSLAGLASGKFHIAFFDHGPEAVMPDYEVSMRYFANGVADNLLMNFGDFSMAGSLKEFKLVPPACG